MYFVEENDSYVSKTMLAVLEHELKTPFFSLKQACFFLKKSLQKDALRAFSFKDFFKKVFIFEKAFDPLFESLALKKNLYIPMWEYVYLKEFLEKTIELFIKEQKITFKNSRKNQIIFIKQKVFSKDASFVFLDPKVFQKMIFWVFSWGGEQKKVQVVLNRDQFMISFKISEEEKVFLKRNWLESLIRKESLFKNNEKKTLQRGVWGTGLEFFWMRELLEKQNWNVQIKFHREEVNFCFSQKKKTFKQIVIQLVNVLESKKYGAKDSLFLIKWDGEKNSSIKKDFYKKITELKKQGWIRSTDQMLFAPEEGGMILITGLCKKSKDALFKKVKRAFLNDLKGTMQGLFLNASEHWEAKVRAWVYKKYRTS